MLLRETKDAHEKKGAILSGFFFAKSITIFRGKAVLCFDYSLIPFFISLLVWFDTHCPVHKLLLERRNQTLVFGCAICDFRSHQVSETVYTYNARSIYMPFTHIHLPAPLAAGGAFTRTIYAHTHTTPFVLFARTPSDVA